MNSIFFFFTITLSLVFASCGHGQNNKDSFRGITILSIGPRGGGHTNAAGKNFAYRIFRVQLINDTIIPAELTINFPGDSVALLPGSDKHVRVFLFPDTLTPDTIQDIYNFGITGLESFLDTGLNKSTMLKTTLQPKGVRVFYIGTVFSPDGLDGLTRSKLFINGQDPNVSFLPVNTLKTDTENKHTLELVFGLAIDPPKNYSFIPCGEIIFKDTKP